jgi:hypothetical protein
MWKEPESDATNTENDVTDETAEALNGSRDRRRVGRRGWYKMADRFDKLTESAPRTTLPGRGLRFNHNYIGTEHLLPLARGRGVAPRYSNRRWLNRSSGVHHPRRSSHRAKSATPRQEGNRLAVDEARWLASLHRHGASAPGLVREGEGIAALRLKASQPDKVRLCRLDPPQSQPRA